MRATDRWAIEEQAIAGIDLMERAGEGVVTVCDDLAPDGPVAIVCGNGNNGGDGYVAARLWRDHGRDVRVLTVGGEPRSGDARTNADRLSGARPVSFEARHLDGAALIVDALLGTGFSGEPRAEYADAIDAINAADTSVVAVDVPSGVNASTGEVVAEAVRADATATFAAAKPGLWIAPGKTHAGEVHVIDIGIPRGAPVSPSVGLIDGAAVGSLPQREQNSTKFASGRVAIAGGSRGLTGAVRLAATAAARAGAGYVTAFVPGSLEAGLEVALVEPMTVGLPDNKGSLRSGAAEIVVDQVTEGVLVLGPGLGRSAFAFARRLAKSAAVPLLIDADGLNAHAGHLRDLRQREHPTILTPHEGELGRLLGLDSAEIKAHRLEHARSAAKASGAIVVLKGDDSLVVAPDGTTLVSRGASPALATAGTGDVLSGTIGALLAAGADPLHAAAAGVLIHARAGRLAAARAGHVTGVIASDVVTELPRARAAA